MQIKLSHQKTTLDGSDQDLLAQVNSDLFAAFPSNDFPLIALSAPARMSGTSSHFALGTPTTTTTDTVSFSDSGIVFNNTFTANVTQAFENCILAAEQTIASEWSNPVTINVEFDAEADGINSFSAINQFSSAMAVSYSTFKSALASLAIQEPGNSILQQAVANLPATDPSGGAGFLLSAPYARLLGLSTTSGSLDLLVTLNTSINWAYGEDVIHTMEHEISEGGMGRYGGLGDEGSLWAPMDLFRYNASGAPDYTDGRDGQTVYFSYNGGATLSLSAGLSFNNQYDFGSKINANDVADFTEPDVFGLETIGSANTLSLSPADIAIMDALGWSQDSQVSVSSVSAATDTKIAYATTGHLVTVMVALSAAVTVSGVPTLQLNDHEEATYASGSGSSTLTFTYAVQAADTTSDLQVTGLNLPLGASIVAGSGNGIAGSVAADLGIQINTPSASVAEQISEIYAAVLQRAPANEEVTSQLALAASNGVAAVVGSVVGSPEAQFNVYPVVQIIKLALSSFPTAAQLAGWLPFVESNGLLQGQSQTNPLLDQMALAFVASDNFGKVYNNGTDVDPNSLVTPQEVEVIIQAATGKAATPTQVASWVATGLTIDQVFVDFALGDQYTQASQSSIQQFLTTLGDNTVGIHSASILGSIDQSNFSVAAHA